MSPTMRALRLHAYRGADGLRLDEVPVPAPGPGEVRVAVAAISLNPVDIKIATGAQRAAVRWRLPHTVGLDVSGVVDALGPGVDDLAVGDAVFASPDHHREGTAAEYVVLPRAVLARAPRALPLADAAALPLVGLTAWDCLVRAAAVRPGERVLVLNGAGGVGTVAVQLAAALGARVTATCGARNLDLVRGLGAAQAIDYADAAAIAALPPQDVVLVAIGGEGVATGVRAAARGGRVTAIVGDLPRHAARWGPWLGLAVTGLHLLGHRVGGAVRGRTVRHVVRQPDGEALAQLAALVDQGAIRPVIEARLPLARFAEAWRLVEAGHVTGKVVVTVGASG